MCECCGGDCKLVSALISTIKDIGKAQAKISDILRRDIFNKLSKHDPYWDSEDETLADKLHDMRITFRCIEEELNEVYCLLDEDDS